MNVRLSLLDGDDGDVGVLAGGDGLLDALALIGLELLLDLDLGPRLDVQRVVVPELVLPRAADDLAADPQAVGELRELHVADPDRDVHRLTLTARVPQSVVVALDAPGGVTRDAVTGLHDVLQVPEVVQALGDERPPFTPLLAVRPVLYAHTSHSTSPDKCPAIHGPNCQTLVT